jgi:hypothetical protein
VDSKANPKSFSSDGGKCTAGKGDFTCIASEKESCNFTLEITSGSVLGVSPSGVLGFLKNNIWYFIIGGAVIVLCVCGFCYYRKKGESH